MLGVNSRWIGMLDDCIVGRFRDVGWLYRQEVQYLFLTRLYHTVQQEFLPGWFLPSPRKLREGSVFTPVCHSVHRGILCPGEVSVREIPQYSNVRTVRLYWNVFLLLLVLQGEVSWLLSLIHLHFITIQLIFRYLRPKLSHLFTNMIKRKPDCWMLVSSVIVLRDVRFVKRPFHIHHLMCWTVESMARSQVVGWLLSLHRIKKNAVNSRGMKRCLALLNMESKNPNLFITARKRSWGQGNIFTPVCQSFCSQWPPKRAVRMHTCLRWCVSPSAGNLDSYFFIMIVFCWSYPNYLIWIAVFLSCLVFSAWSSHELGSQLCCCVWYM